MTVFDDPIAMERERRQGNLDGVSIKGLKHSCQYQRVKAQLSVSKG